MTELYFIASYATFSSKQAIELAQEGAESRSLEVSARATSSATLLIQNIF
jgi:hypothetical protein